MNYYFVVEYVRSMFRQCPSPPHFSPQIKDDSYLAYKAFLGCKVTKFCMVTKTAVKKSKLIKIARNRISKVIMFFKISWRHTPDPCNHIPLHVFHHAPRCLCWILGLLLLKQSDCTFLSSMR